MVADDTAQRTLLVLFAPEAHLGAPYARRVLSAAGLVVVKEDKLSGEELEEAGVDVGGGGGASGEQAQLPSHVAMVVEGVDAVARLRDLRSGTLATECPTLRTFAAPSLDAASMATEILFPCLDDKEEAGSPAAAAPSTAQPETAPKPFALSNAAFEAKQDATTVAPPTVRRLSPAIEKALAEVEAREEQQRLRKLSRSSRGSAGGTPSPLASRDASTNGTDVEPTFERRVFTLARSPSPEPESDHEPEPTATGAAIEQVVQVEHPTVQVSAAVQEQAAREEVPTEPATPTRSRVPSALSDRSHTSSTRRPGTSASAPPSNGFRARPAPASAAKPAIPPRMTKAAALRLGIALPPPRPAATPRRSTLASPDPAGPSSRSSTTTPAAGSTLRSLAQPSITPRLTKAAALRLGPAESVGDASRSQPRVRQSISTAERAALDRARRQSALGTGRSASAGPGVRDPATSASARAPAPVARVEVKMSRAALLRQGLGVGPRAATRPAHPSTITSTRIDLGSSVSAVRAPTAGGGVAGRRSLGSTELKSLREPAVAPRMTKAASLRAGAGAGAGAGTSSTGTVRSSTESGARSVRDGQGVKVPRSSSGR